MRGLLSKYGLWYIVLVVIVCLSIVFSLSWSRTAFAFDGALVPDHGWDLEKTKSCLASVYVCPEAHITQLTYNSADTEKSGESQLQVKTVIKNISDTPKRFLVSISLFGGVSGQALCPQEKGCLEPGGEELCIVSIAFHKNPDGMTLEVDQAPTAFSEKLSFLVNSLVNRITEWLLPGTHKKAWHTVRIFSEPESP